ncbi:MAG: cyclic nucleotide-binding domain-containing protein [Eubacteriales bacterium]|nr:cyclic nucleotide-binding domain-containing protein [Eubacteriales bacterium]
MDRKSFKAGEIIFKEGSAADTMFRIEKGEVKVIAKYGKANEVEVATIKPGKFFGEMGVIENARRSATIIAKSDVDVLVIDKTSFPNFVANNPEDAIKIMQNMSKNLRATTADYIDACKTINELMQDDSDKPKKEGILAKLKKFADIYNESYSDIYTDNETNNYVPYLYCGHYMYL